MTDGRRLILWDFDGTLAYRPGLWRGCLMEILDEHEPGHGVHIDQLRPFLQNGFPWHRADVIHPELGEPEAWWEPIETMMAAAYAGVGLAPERARTLSRHAHERFIDPGRGWCLFEDTLPVLERLRDRGWTHVILSNHVPELEALVGGLGLAPLIDRVNSSAVSGFEKPHPEAFRHALAPYGEPQSVWMVGDNPVADFDGALGAGLAAILVRTAADRPGRVADLEAAAAIIDGGRARDGRD